jgi:3-hydroxyisobutyrate dehydrogenase-like beta-hydroxyacid dehydrogenase
MRKDVRLAMALAAATETPANVTALVGTIWADSADKLAADADYTAVAGDIIDQA